MSVGAVTMYMIHSLLTSGKQMADLTDALEALSLDTAHGTPGSTYCCQAIQFTFAANRHIGKLSDLCDDPSNQREYVMEG